MMWIVDARAFGEAATLTLSVERLWKISRNQQGFRAEASSGDYAPGNDPHGP
jgi:hypothetical protein